MDWLLPCANLGGLAESIRGLDQAWPAANPMLLLAAIALPLLAGTLLLLTGESSPRRTRLVAALGYILPAALATWLWLSYLAADASGAYLFQNDWPTGLQAFGISLKTGLNGLSAPLLLLAGWVGLAAGLYSLSQDIPRAGAFHGLVLILLAGLMGIFATTDILFLYLFHEVALIPTFLTIGIWGGRGRRMAAMEMTLYLTLGAMLSLAGLIALYAESGAASFDLLQLGRHLALLPLSECWQRTVAGLLLVGLGTLVSLWPLHSWAPRGYAAAPAATAMLHAGVLKKFGLYTLLQIAWPMFPQGLAHWAAPLAWLALGNVVVIGLVTLAQRDLKLMLGYGSVMHMGYAFLGLATLSATGLGGTAFFLFAHGVSVALLFLLADALEKRTGTLEFADLGGLAAHTPTLAACFVAAMLASLGLPGLANFWGELAIFVALFDRSPWFAAAATSGLILSAIYGLRACSRIFFGEPGPALRERSSPPADLSEAEKAPVILLLALLLLVGFMPRTISGSIDDAIARMRPPSIPASACSPACADPAGPGPTAPAPEPTTP